MMPSHPIQSSFSFAFLTEPGTGYQTSCWRGHDGEANGSVSYWKPGCPFTIQGPPAALRELAAALTRAADETEQAFPVQAAAVAAPEGVGA
jgi:hypothetical protein